MLLYRADEESRLLLLNGHASYESMDAENGATLGALHGPEDLRDEVYGTFYTAATRTGCFWPFAQANAPRWRKVLSALPFLVVLVILAVRAIYFSIQMGSMPPLSMDWGFSVLLFFSSLHGFVSFAELRKLICKTNFFDTYLNHLYTVTRHRMPTLTVKSRILPTVFLVFCIYSTVFYCVNKTLQLMATLADGNSTVPHDGIDQAMAYSFDALNVITMLMSAYFSAVALTLYILSFTTACSEYNEFHEEVSKAIENGDINKAQVLRGFDIRHNQLLRLVRFCNLGTRDFAGISFVFGLFANVSIGFISGAFSASMPIFDKINVYNWTILSVFLLVVALKKPYDLHYKILATKDALLLEYPLWQKPDVANTARAIVDRVRFLDYYSIQPILFHVIFVAQFVLIVIMVGLKAEK